MKILLVAPLHPGSLGYICRKALRDLGHEVPVFDYREHVRKDGPIASWLKPGDRVQRMNKDFVRCVEKERPDLLLVFKGETISPDSLSEVKRRFKPYMVSWHPDNPYNVLCSSVYLVYGMTLYDLVLLFDPYYLPEVRQLGVKNADYLPLCAAAEPEWDPLESTCRHASLSIL